jgi:4-hydroxybenzoate polyprenyltransferase/phosphoserine phosphatase
VTVAEQTKAMATPLCVDLDGTLVETDTLWESLLLLARERVWDLFLLPVWLVRGKAYFKRQVADRVSPAPGLLPYREDLVSFLREERAAGRPLVLATASDVRVARSVADFLGLFDDVIATEATRNLSGRHKLEAIRTRHGAEFDYVGDSRDDLPIWQACRTAYVADPSWRLLRRLTARAAPARVFRKSQTSAEGLLRALRPHQWVKNALVFVPLVLAHQIADPVKVASAVFAFGCFSLCASAGYVLNDILDLAADRQHPIKRKRPFASGAVPLPIGIALSIALAMAGTAGSLLVGFPLSFMVLLACYLALTVLYSVYVKRKLLLDVLLLAGLYTLRVLAGGRAVQVPVSTWLLVFSMFMFLSLAFAKRYTELRQVLSKGGREAMGRNYRVDELDLILSCGATSGFLAVLVLALYISSDEVRRFYANPGALWFICPLLLYWVLRVWFLAKRGELEGDPVAFAIRDRNSLLTCAVTALLFSIASRWRL